MIKAEGNEFKLKMLFLPDPEVKHFHVNYHWTEEFISWKKFCDISASLIILLMYLCDWCVCSEKWWIKVIIVIRYESKFVKIIPVITVIVILIVMSAIWISILVLNVMPNTYETFRICYFITKMLRSS